MKKQANKQKNQQDHQQQKKTKQNTKKPTNPAMFPAVTAAINWQRDALIRGRGHPYWFKTGGHQSESNLHLKMNGS